MSHVERRHKKWRKWLYLGLCPGTAKNETNRPAHLALPVAHSTGSEFKKVSGRDGFETRVSRHSAVPALWLHLRVGHVPRRAASSGSRLPQAEAMTAANSTRGRSGKLAIRAVAAKASWSEFSVSPS